MSNINTHIICLTLLLGLIGNAASAGSLREGQAESKGDKQDKVLLKDNESSLVSMGLPKGAKLLKDVAYGEAAEQKMDVYLPAHAENAPIIFMVHGGAWFAGDKAMNEVVENKVARWVACGFIFVSANYRLLPKAGVPMQADDVARAMAAAQSMAATWGGDPAKLILMGHSSAGLLVTLLGASPFRANAQGVRPWLGTISLDSSAMNVVEAMEREHPDFFDNAFGKDETFWKSASPFHVLTAKATPMLLVCSTTRPDKPCDQARVFAAKAAGLGVRTEVSGHALSHVEIDQMLGLPVAYTDAVERFMGSLDAAVGKRLVDCRR